MLSNNPKRALFLNNCILLTFLLMLSAFLIFLYSSIEYEFTPHVDEIDISTMVDVLQEEENRELLELALEELQSHIYIVNLFISKGVFFVLAFLLIIILENIYLTKKVHGKEDEEDDFELAKSLGFSLVKKNSLLGKILPPAMNISGMTDKPISQNEFRKAIDRLSHEYNFRVTSATNHKCELKVPGRTFIFRQSKVKQIIMNNSIRSRLSCTLLENGCVSIESWERVIGFADRDCKEAMCETLRHRLELTKKVFQEIV